MNKTLIALAVAGLVAAPMAAQAEVAVGGSIGLQYSTYGGTKAADLSSDDSSINFTASSEIDSGSTVYMRIRIDGGLSNNVSDGSGADDSFGVRMDAVKVGIKGDFGDFGLGEQGNPVDFGQRANDVQDVTGDNNSISYKNSVGDIKFQVTMSPEGNDDTSGGGIQWSSGAYAVGFGTLSGATSATDVSAFGASASFGDIGVDVHSAEVGADDITALRVRWANGPLAIAYTSSSKEFGAGGPDSDATSLQVRYSLGGGLDIELEVEDPDVGDATKEYTRIMMEYSF